MDFNLTDNQAKSLINWAAGETLKTLNLSNNCIGKDGADLQGPGRGRSRAGKAHQWKSAPGPQRHPAVHRPGGEYGRPLPGGGHRPHQVH